MRQLKEKSVRTKQGVFAALQQLVTVASDSIGSHTAQMVPGIQAALNVSPSTISTALNRLYVDVLRVLIKLANDIKHSNACHCS